MSNEDVASSNSKIGGFFKSVRAIPTLCFSPPDNFSPRSPTVVLYPSGKFEIKLWIFADLAAVITESSSALRLP